MECNFAFKMALFNKLMLCAIVIELAYKQSLKFLISLGSKQTGLAFQLPQRGCAQSLTPNN